jgi:hypothetical protein
MTSGEFDPDALLDADVATLDVPPGPAFAAWHLRVLSHAEFDAFKRPGSEGLLSAAQLAYLAWLNLLAPTTHNTVPQRLAIHDGEGALAVWIDRERILPESDGVGRQALVSLGCGIANVVLGARTYGWAAEVEVLPVAPERLRPSRAGEPQKERVAVIRFQRNPEGRDDVAWVRAMLSRKVVRAEFDERVKLDADLPAELAAIAARFPALELHLLTDAPSLLFLGKFQELADTTVVNRDAFALELGAWLLLDDAPNAVGMRGREFGLSPEATRRMRDGLLRRAPLLPDEIAGFAKVGNVGMRSSSAVAVLTVDDDGTAQRIDAGRAYEEMALLLERRGFATAMHAGITEVDAPNFALRGRLRTRRRPDVLFRIGRVLHATDGERPHSSRPHLRDVLIRADP